MRVYEIKDAYIRNKLLHIIKHLIPNSHSHIIIIFQPTFMAKAELQPTLLTYKQKKHMMFVHQAE